MRLLRRNYILLVIVGLLWHFRGNFWKGQRGHESPRSKANEIDAFSEANSASGGDDGKDISRDGAIAGQSDEIGKKRLPGSKFPDVPRLFPLKIAERVNKDLNDACTKFGILKSVPEEIDWLAGVLESEGVLRSAIVVFLLSSEDYHDSRDGAKEESGNGNDNGYVLSTRLLLHQLLVNQQTRTKLANTDVVLLLGSSLEASISEGLTDDFRDHLSASASPRLIIKTVEPFDLKISPEGKSAAWKERWNLAFSKLLAFDPLTFRPEPYQFVFVLDADMMLVNRPLDFVFERATNVLGQRLGNCAEASTKQAFQTCVQQSYIFASHRHEVWEKGWKDAGPSKRPIFKASAFLTIPSAFHSRRLFETAHRDWGKWKWSRQENGLLNHYFAELLDTDLDDPKDDPASSSSRKGGGLTWMELHQLKGFLVNLGPVGAALQTSEQGLSGLTLIHGPNWRVGTPFHQRWIGEYSQAFGTRNNS